MTMAYNFLGDELVNKIQVLTTILNNTKSLVSQLEIENKILKDALMNLASQQTEDSDSTNEALCA